MGIFAKKHLLTDTKYIFKVGLILLFAISLVACKNQASLSRDINALILEKSIDLSISQHDGVFVPASSSFAQRMIGALSSHDAALAKVSDVDQYDLALRFDGYRDIHLNLDSNSFWFAGGRQVYPLLADFNSQWQRYMIRMADGELRYDGFEKTILRKSSFTDQNESVNTATLFYDGDIRLSVNRSQIKIASNVSENSLDYNDSNYPKDTYDIKLLGRHPLVAVVHTFPTVHGPNAKLDVFSYNDEDIQPVFSTSDMTCELDAIDFEKGKVMIRLPFADTTATHLLTSQERARTDEKLSELNQNKVKIDEEFIKSTKDGISCGPTEAAFKDTDGDGIEEMLISTHVESVGARTPIWLNAYAVFTFGVQDDVIRFKEVTFEDEVPH